MVSGTLLMQFRDPRPDVTVRPGEFVIVPRGVEHRPAALPPPPSADGTAVPRSASRRGRHAFGRVDANTPSKSAAKANAKGGGKVSIIHL